MSSRPEPDVPANAGDQTAETIAVREHTALQSADHEAFFTVLDTPPTPTEALRTAFARHSTMIVSQ